ncbi:hypothetical protein B0T26DRAFT_753295 [Lasiosphaeria miniovina]|uniref:Uncharacterized protein n=1 Tax=Lasiosphaeria miniovina TaxID=1954250 RepID=A0AA40AC64_9PEZI|nr:uncharacterized protein B0T26DRAFT_753295 [Lasiosphaeria miniovina]KAK0713153.1 hypothetical protein B0T26DRAFT_753295 [Lasiosphaeria miniovina]
MGCHFAKPKPPEFKVLLPEHTSPTEPISPGLSIYSTSDSGSISGGEKHRVPKKHELELIDLNEYCLDRIRKQYGVSQTVSRVYSCSIEGSPMGPRPRTQSNRGSMTPPQSAKEQLAAYRYLPGAARSRRTLSNPLVAAYLEDKKKRLPSYPSYGQPSESEGHIDHIDHIEDSEAYNYHHPTAAMPAHLRQSVSYLRGTYFDPSGPIDEDASCLSSTYSGSSTKVEKEKGEIIQIYLGT